MRGAQGRCGEAGVLGAGRQPQPSTHCWEAKASEVKGVAGAIADATAQARDKAVPPEVSPRLFRVCLRSRGVAALPSSPTDDFS